MIKQKGENEQWEMYKEGTPLSSVAAENHIFWVDEVIQDAWDGAVSDPCLSVRGQVP